MAYEESEKYQCLSYVYATGIYLKLIILVKIREFLKYLIVQYLTIKTEAVEVWSLIHKSNYIYLFFNTLCIELYYNCLLYYFTYSLIKSIVLSEWFKRQFMYNTKMFKMFVSYLAIIFSIFI